MRREVAVIPAPVPCIFLWDCDVACQSPSSLGRGGVKAAKTWGSQRAVDGRGPRLVLVPKAGRSRQITPQLRMQE